MRIAFSFALAGVALGLLGGCSFDFTGFGHGGAGGAATGTTSHTGVGPSSTGAGSTTSSVGTSTSVGSQSSSGVGGAPGDLARCGGITDTFDAIGAAWTKDETISNNGNKVTAQADGDGKAGLFLASGDHYTECYASIRLVNVPGDPGVPVAIGVSDKAVNFTTTSYRGDQKQLFTFPGTMTEGVSNDPTFLGIAFHGPTVTYLFAGSDGVWVKLSSAPRASWLDDGMLDYVFFGLASINGATAVFDDFNVNPITTANL